MLRYALSSLALFGAALGGLIYYYEFLNFHGAHGVAIVAVFFFALFLLGATLSLDESTESKRLRTYLRYVGYITLGLVLFFGALWGIRFAVLWFVRRYLPESAEGLAEIVFIAAFLGMIYVVIQNADSWRERFLDRKER